ncbi:unnamed protein product, partial [Chrysoparadoxa australica]
AYFLAVDLHKDNIQRSKTSTDPFKYEKMVYEYAAINNLYDAIARCPGCRKVVPNPEKYDSELSGTRIKAAEYRYQLGMNAFEQKENRDKAKEAHGHFSMASEFVPRYRDIEDKMNESLFYATMKIVVEPIPSPVRVFDLKHEFFVNKINEYLHNNMINQYVRFYTPSEAKIDQLPFIDHYIQMEFDRFNLGSVSSRTYEKETSRDSVEVGTTKSGEKVFGTVKAVLKVNERSLTGSGLLDFKVLDGRTRKVLTQEKFPSEYVWTARWANFNGDERALSEEEVDMVNRVEVSIPGPQVMFEEFTAPLYDQVISKITAYYRYF